MVACQGGMRWMELRRATKRRPVKSGRAKHEPIIKRVSLEHYTVETIARLLQSRETDRHGDGDVALDAGVAAPRFIRLK